MYKSRQVKSSEVLLYSLQTKTWVPYMNNKQTNKQTKSTGIKDSQVGNESEDALKRNVLVEVFFMRKNKTKQKNKQKQTKQTKILKRKTGRQTYSLVEFVFTHMPGESHHR